MVPNGRRHKSHSECHNQLIGNQEMVLSHEMPLVYAKKLATIDELCTKLERKIAAVSVDLCLKIVKNWVQRLEVAMQKISSFIHNGSERTFTDRNKEFN